MKALHTFLPALFLLTFAAASAQEAGDGRLKEINDMAKKDTLGWTTGGGIGLDLAGMGLLNPKVGAGGNRLGIGGLGTLFANRKEDKWFWDNGFSLQLSAQRLGKTSANQASGFQKNLDVLRLTSRYGHKLGSDKWSTTSPPSAKPTAWWPNSCRRYRSPCRRASITNPTSTCRFSILPPACS